MEPTVFVAMGESFQVVQINICNDKKRTWREIGEEGFFERLSASLSAKLTDWDCINIVPDVFVVEVSAPSGRDHLECVRKACEDFFGSAEVITPFRESRIIKRPKPAHNDD